MWFRSTHGFRKSRSARTPARRRRPSAARLACEVLESRCLLSYTITDLGGLAQAFPMNFGYAVNNHSQVAGRSNFPGGSSAAAMWDNGAITQLTPRGGTAYGINDQTQVVGDFPVSGTSHAFLWQAGVLTDLGTPPGNGSSQGVRINNVGQIAVSANSGNHAYLWQGGIWTNLGTLGGGSSNPGGINDQGQVVGTSVTASGAYHAFLWQGGVMSDLGTLGGASGASAINNQGQV